MKKEEKSILKSIYLVTLLMFFQLSISFGKFDFLPIILGLSSCILIAYSYFIISRFFPAGDKYLLILSSFITQFGLVMIYRLNSQNPVRAIKQITFFTIGIAAYIFLVIFLPEIKKFERLRYVYIIITIVLLSSTLFLGREIKGSKNWIQIGRFNMQPSEIAKLFLILYLSSSIKYIKNFYDALKESIPVFISIGLLVVEKDLGAGLIFFGIYITMLYIGTSNFKYILSAVIIFLLGGLASYFIFPHVKVRIDIWLNPFAYKTGKGYQICQSLFAIAAGGLFGTGLGLGYPQFIPEVHNDFIFSAICEEFGLLGASALILLYILLVYRGLRTAIYAKDDYSRLVAVGISSMLAFQIFVVIGGVTKMIPMTGITLPFVSYGGSSMLLNFICLGVLQKISESGWKENE
ncbi:cell division protein FtsW, lipid II flippase [Caloramator quimbayensis]|uniref:Cell division protein FtsW, lipid II flippase n=1 Tax=Caloramator quimbayensis TaxID=1147123 RepID=A0A1T4Y9G3_9CLOT|nr:FtsW/RodA/SpoVE family cell cycle protein [Caloramator quimbayensis]SKA98484.1 cell division protein FtsW, lipid II flippase [Caloramator quimbayensis]